VIQTPINPKVVRQKIDEMNLPCVGLASIRELNRIVDNIVKETGDRFIRMEMGIPGLKPPEIAVEAEIEALRTGIGSIYPPFDGIPELKKEISLFVENFMSLTISVEVCFSNVGFMQGCYIGLVVWGRRKS